MFLNKSIYSFFLYPLYILSFLLKNRSLLNYLKNIQCTHNYNLTFLYYELDLIDYI